MNLSLFFYSLQRLADEFGCIYLFTRCKKREMIYAEDKIIFIVNSSMIYINKRTYHDVFALLKSVLTLSQRTRLNLDHGAHR